MLPMSNQSPVHAGHNAFAEDGVLQQLTRHLPASVVESFSEHGKWVASAEAQDLARLANEHAPILRTHDSRGDREDVVEFHPAYHALMRRAVSMGLHSSIWEDIPDETGHRHLSRAVRFMMTCGLEAGHTCPITMTNAGIAALMTTPQLMKDWSGRILSRKYDSSQRSPGSKSGLTIGMGMTEREGGSDVRTNKSVATRTNVGGADGMWRINGQKWFLSAPMCDAFFILANTDAGPTCFLLPRRLPDGNNNGLQFQRLKDKLGNRSNASSEVVFHDALGSLVGEEGKGINAILEMVTLTRLDCLVSSAGHMRVALSQAVHHARHRRAFGKLLIDQPLMQSVLADMSLDVAAAQALALRVARSFDLAPQDSVEGGFARLITPVAKYWVCKLAPSLVVEAMECLGGNGFVESGPMARLYREAPLNAIWEGAGNIMCLDVLRVMRKSPNIMESVLERLAEDFGGKADQTIDVLRVAGKMALEDEGSARMFTEQLALTAAAAEMKRTLPGEIADAFVETRLGRPWRHTYGMLDSRTSARGIVDYVIRS